MNRWFWALLGTFALFVGCDGSKPTEGEDLSSSSSVSPIFFSSAEVNQWSQGNGTEESPYMINSADDLVALSNAVSQGVTYAGTFFKLGGNISLSGLSWTPIGVWGEDDLGWKNKPFRGSFDGGGFTISNLTMNNTSVNYVGLFGLTKQAVIKNLKLESISLSANKILGGLVAKADSTSISDCELSVSLIGQERVGGIVGEMIAGSITNSIVSGSVEGKSTVGGLVGLIGSSATVSGTNQATVTGTLQNTGGISGTVSGGIITEAINQGLVSGILNVGGIVGNVTMAGQISWVSNQASITASGTNSFVGGVVGDLASSSVLEASYNLGEISSTGIYAAGIVGKMTSSEIRDVFNHGKVSATDYVGGLVGKCGENAKINTGYNKGSVTVTKNSASLLAETLSTTEFSNLYYDNVLALVSSSEAGGVSSVEMASATMAATLNNGTKTIWTSSATEMGGYPYLTK